MSSPDVRSRPTCPADAEAVAWLVVVHARGRGGSGTFRFVYLSQDEAEREADRKSQNVGGFAQVFPLFGQPLSPALPSEGASAPTSELVADLWMLIDADGYSALHGDQRDGIEGVAADLNSGTALGRPPYRVEALYRESLVAPLLAEVARLSDALRDANAKHADCWPLIDRQSAAILELQNALAKAERVCAQEFGEMPDHSLSPRQRNIFGFDAAARSTGESPK